MQVTYKFGGGAADGDASMVTMLGGKGAGLAEMSKMGIHVPPGFTVPTNFCVAHMNGDKTILEWVMPDVIKAYNGMTADLGGNPLLVSVRSGAPVSMPGMMDTILNVGMTTGTLPYWIEKLGPRTAFDCYRRLIQMLGATAYGVPHDTFEALLTKARFANKARQDSELSADALKKLCEDYLSAFNGHTGKAFPNTVNEQLEAAVRAVFDSWANERARIYRDMNKIDHGMGTAVTVQAMVFGNLNDDSGSGVLFTRHPSTGKKEIMGEFLPNAQGEDVVAGIRTPLPMAELNVKWPEVGQQIVTLCMKLEGHYKDMMDVEFTVQDKVLYLLQCRVGKRSPLAKLVIAYSLFLDGVIDLPKVLKRLSRDDIRSILRPQVDPNFKTAPNWTGIGSGPGVAKGKVVLTSEDAINCKDPCILVRDETDPDDIGGMSASAGILTRTGGATSHAAVVARAMDKACVVGCTGLPAMATMEGHQLTIDGATGRVWMDVAVPVIDASDCRELSYLAQRIASGSGTRIALTQEQFGLWAGAGSDAILVALKGEKPNWWENAPFQDTILDLDTDPRPEGDDGLTKMFNMAPPPPSTWGMFPWDDTEAFQHAGKNGALFLGSPAQRKAWATWGVTKDLKFVGSDTALAITLGAKIKKWYDEAKNVVGVDLAKLGEAFLALDQVPVGGCKTVTAQPPAYIVMSALGE